MNESLHILIVDDSPEDTLMYRRFVSGPSQNRDFTFSAASSGKEGLHLATSLIPDCILLDSTLPDMTGLEFLQQLPHRDGKPSIPTIMLTNQGNEGMAVSSLKNGADDYLVKGTLTAQELIISILDALNKAALTQARREHQAHIHIDHILVHTETLTEGATEIIRAIGMGMGWQACSLWTPTSSQTHLECIAEWHDLGVTSRDPNSLDPSQTFFQHTQQALLGPGTDLPGQSWKTGKIVFVKNLTLLDYIPRIHSAIELGFIGACALPLYFQDRIFAILECWYQHPRQISQDRLSILTAFTNQLTRLFENKQVEQHLREREMEYRLVTDHVPALIASFDHQRRYRLANQPYQEWFHQSEEAIIGHHAKEVLGEKLYAQMEPYMDQVLSGDIVNFELLTQHADGTQRWLQATYVPDLGEEQDIRGFYSLISDITHRKFTEERLRLQTQELARSNAELEQFAHIASHDLQEPLRKVQAFSDRLRSRAADRLGPHELEYLDRMHKATNRMQTLIQDLLAFSRVGTKPQVFQAVDLQKILSEVLNDLETLIVRTGACIQYDRLPTIEADPTQIRQLFQNLIGNALKFHPADSPPHVRILTEEETLLSEGSQACRIGVQDNGIGFDQQYADRIFGVFQRLHGRDEYEGTGIGLSICKKVVERHGGTISAIGRPDKGATFWITLPITQAHSSNRKIYDTESPKPVIETVQHQTASLAGST